MEKDLNKKWAVLVVDPSISVLNKCLTVPFEDILPFKDSVDRHLEAFLKAFFALSGSALQPAIDAMSIYQTIAKWTGQMNGDNEPVFDYLALLEQL